MPASLGDMHALVVGAPGVGKSLISDLIITGKISGLFASSASAATGVTS